MEKLIEFKKMGLSEPTLKALKRKGFEEPTPIQKEVIPFLLQQDKDLIGQAHTGTGKTAAFGLPILEQMEPGKKHIQVLALVPTRELAIQVAEELNSLKARQSIRIIPIYGGQSIDLQFKRLKKGVDIVVGTPGRIIDHLNRKTMKLHECTRVVLDEADEMLNMGFIDDIKSILTATDPGRQTLLFSATMPKEILAVAKSHMRDYETISITKKELTVDLTDQIYFEVNRADKFEALCRIVDVEEDFYGLVFCRTKNDVDQVSNQMADRGYDVAGLHGDISQAQREKILSKFKRKRINILVATDVAARGIDIRELSHVINFSIPQDPESYVHRVGRTGRAGQQGTAITFITPEEYRKLSYIKRITKTEIRREKLPQVDDIIRMKKKRIKSELNALVNDRLPAEYLHMALDLLDNNEPQNVVAAMLKHIFANELDRSTYNEIRDVHPKIQGKTRLFIGYGKKDRLTKRSLVEEVKKLTGIPDRKIDNVQVFERYSLITLPFRDAEKILHTYQSQRRGKQPVVRIAKENKPHTTSRGSNG